MVVSRSYCSVLPSDLLHKVHALEVPRVVESTIEEKGVLAKVNFTFLPQIFRDLQAGSGRQKRSMDCFKSVPSACAENGACKTYRVTVMVVSISLV